MANKKIYAFLVWMKNETLLVIPAIIYFMIAFNLIHFTVDLNAPPDQIHYFSFLELTLGALIVGKVLILTNALPFFNAFANKSLIYSIVWKFFIYLSFIFLLWALDAIVHVSYLFKSINVAFFHLLDEIQTPIFFSCVLWLSYVLLIFVVISEYMRVLGKKRIIQILLG